MNVKYHHPAEVSLWFLPDRGVRLSGRMMDIMDTCIEYLREPGNACWDLFFG